MAVYDHSIPKDLLAQAQGGDAEAQYLLGLFYATDEEVRENLITAHMWFNLAATAGDQRARIERQEMAEMMSNLEVAEAQRRARAFLRAAA